MSKFVRGVLGLIAGYAVGLAAGALLVSLFSTNSHDKDLEVIMTAAFVTGPLGALSGVVIAFMQPLRSPPGDAS